MARLQSLSNKLRLTLIAEAAKKPVVASENVAEDALMAANSIRDCLKVGDKAEQAALDLSKACAAAASAEDYQASKRAAVDVKSGIASLETVRNELYGPYAEARDTAYKLAAAWGLSTTVSSDKPKSKPSDVTAMSEKDLAQQIGVAAKTLQTNVRDMLEKGATTQKLLRAAAKKLGLEQGELGDDEKQAIVSALLAFRTAVDPIYGRTQGIKKRAEELHAKLTSREKYEAKKASGKKTLESDRELATYEII
jgi:hypothetical protein